MTISVITINYNNREGLRKTIESVLGQTCQDFEYVIVDGGSTDGSKELIENLLAEYKGGISVKWVSEPDHGIYNAMNKGVSMSSGDYCQFLNSGDTYYSSSVVQDVVDSGLKADIVVGNTLFSNGNVFKSPASVSLELFIHGTLSHPSAFSKRRLLLENPFDENLRIVSDMKFFLVTTIFKNASYMPLDITVARFELDGISSTQNEQKQEERRTVLSQLIPERVLADYQKFLGDNDEYYKLFTCVYHSRFKYLVYNFCLLIIKTLLLNRSWAGKMYFCRK